MSSVYLLPCPWSYRSPLTLSVTLPMYFVVSYPVHDPIDVLCCLTKRMPETLMHQNRYFSFLYSKESSSVFISFRDCCIASTFRDAHASAPNLPCLWKMETRFCLCWLWYSPPGDREGSGEAIVGRELTAGLHFTTALENISGSLELVEMIVGTILIVRLRLGLGCVWVSSSLGGSSEQISMFSSNSSSSFFSPLSADHESPSWLQQASLFSHADSSSSSTILKSSSCQDSAARFTRIFFTFIVSWDLQRLVLAWDPLADILLSVSSTACGCSWLTVASISNFLHKLSVCICHLLRGDPVCHADHYMLPVTHTHLLLLWHNTLLYTIVILGSLIAMAMDCASLFLLMMVLRQIIHYNIILPTGMTYHFVKLFFVVWLAFLCAFYMSVIQFISSIHAVSITYLGACGLVDRALDSRSEGLGFDSQCWLCVEVLGKL